MVVFWSYKVLDRIISNGEKLWWRTANTEIGGVMGSENTGRFVANSTAADDSVDALFLVYAGRSVINLVVVDDFHRLFNRVMFGI